MPLLCTPLRTDVDQCHARQFRAGQWLDVFVPGLRKAGGFTITSTPYQALDEPGNRPFVELAVQNSPRNPPAAWLWDDPSRVLKQHLKVRVGGSFTWPAEDVDSRTINHVLFIAAGVGVNPLMSMLSHFFHPQSPRQDWSHITVSLLYTSKQNNAPTAAEVLFLSRILDLASKNQPQLRCQIHLTGASASSQIDSPHARFEHRRPTREDYERLLGEPSQRKLALCYVCGPQAMTDETVGLLQGLDGMRSDRVLCEKWW